MLVLKAGLHQAVSEPVTVELGIMAGIGSRADVNQKLDAMRLQEFQKLLDGSRRMADGPDAWWFLIAHGRRYMNGRS